MDGPSSSVPSAVKREPCSGQSHEVSAAFHCRMPPRCGQIPDTEHTRPSTFDVATTEAHIPDPEVVDHDPGVALWAGEDGLDVIRLVERAARRLLKPGGRIVVEHSDRQGRTAPEVFVRAGGWTEVQDHRDLAGRDRFVTARWTGAA